MKRILILFILIINLTSFAQTNLVPNPSFEEIDSIPLYNSSGEIYDYNFLPKYWFNPVPCGFELYWNSLLNYVDTIPGLGYGPYSIPQNAWTYTFPKDGNAYSSFCPFVPNFNPLYQGNRNYLEVMLNQPLLAYHKYCLCFFISFPDSCYKAIDEIGAYFSSSQLYIPNTGQIVPCYFLLNPQIISPSGYFFNKRNKWEFVSGSFYSNGGEQYMTIGNFKSDTNTNYVYVPDSSSNSGNAWYNIDLVTLIECSSNIIDAFAGEDTAICKWDSIVLGSVGNMLGYEFAWSPGTGLSDSCVRNPKASPAQTTTYTLTQNYFGSDTTSDAVTVSVIICNPGVDEFYSKLNFIIVYPNPANKLLNIDGLSSSAMAEICDISGKLLLIKQLKTTQIDISSLAKGLYFIKLRTEEGSVVRKFVKE